MLLTQKFPAHLDPSFLTPYKTAVPPWGPIGYITYKRTYSRPLPSGRKEEWWETCNRVCEGLWQINTRLEKAEMERLYDYLFHLKASVSGRALWQLGTETVRRHGLDSLQNCWFVEVNDPVKPACFLFNELMLGGGVGFGILPESVYEIPIVKFRPQIRHQDTADVDFIVPDNREGWVELLRLVLERIYYTGATLTYSTQCVRPNGAKIGGFGGVASGPGILHEGIGKIVKVFAERYLKKMRPIDWLDVMNILGSVVVAGNVRRSSEIALGAHKDVNFLNAKNWALGDIPDWRRMSNNTVLCEDTRKLPAEFWAGYEGNGEPYGLFNLGLSRTVGRSGEVRPDTRVVGINPCAEQILESYEACNLSELFLPNLTAASDLFDASTLLYKVCKTISGLPAIHPETREVVGRNRRIGVGVTGWMERPDLHDGKLLGEVYEAMDTLDVAFSKELGCPRSVKLTTTKPSGTLSTLAGVTSGVHPAFAKHFIRRVRFSSDDPLVEVCKEHGFKTEPQMKLDGTQDLRTTVVEFPAKYAATAICAKDVTAVDQLEHAANLQACWSDSAVSVTVYYRKDELPGIRMWLDKNWATRLKTVSFLLHQGHGFNQAPYEEITEDQYRKISSLTRPITRTDDTGDFAIESNECSQGVCPIK